MYFYQLDGPAIPQGTDDIVWAFLRDRNLNWNLKSAMGVCIEWMQESDALKSVHA